MKWGVLAGKSPARWGLFSEISSGLRASGILLNDTRRAECLIANTPHFMVLLINIPVIENLDGKDDKWYYGAQQNCSNNDHRMKGTGLIKNIDDTKLVFPSRTHVELVTRR